MTGLNSPRGLGFAPNGDLVVAEAGTAPPPAPTVSTRMPCRRRIRPDLHRLVRLDLRARGRGAPISSADRPAGRAGGANTPNQPFVEVTGPQDIDFPTKGRAFVTVGWGGTPAARSAPAAKGKAFGRLVQTGPNGGRRTAADIAGLRAGVQPRAVARSTRTPTASSPSRAARTSPTPAPTRSTRSRAGTSRSWRRSRRAAHLHDSVPRATGAGVGADDGRPGAGQGALRRRADGVPVLRRRRSDLAGRPRRGADRASSPASR